MLTCIACSKKVTNGSLEKKKKEKDHGYEDDREDEEEETVGTPTSRSSIKNLTSQIKEMAVKASGAYKSCKPCSGYGDGRNDNLADSETSSLSGKYNHHGYRRTGAVVGGSARMRVWGKEMEARLKGLSSGEGTPVSFSGRTESIVLVEDDEPKEWVAQVEPGVLITLVSMPHGGNELKRIRFSRELFNKWQAQRWWAENEDKVMELYNVKRSSSFPTPQRPEEQGGKSSSVQGIPTTPPLSKESIPRNHHRSTGVGYSSSDSLEHQKTLTSNHDLDELVSASKFSDISAAKMETASVDASARSSSSGEADGSEEHSVSNGSEVETEWVEEDEPGVYITIRALADGTRELRRVRFSRERFGEMHARMWWEENKARIQEQYL